MKLVLPTPTHSRCLPRNQSHRNRQVHTSCRGHQFTPEEIVQAEEPEVIEECPDRIYSAIQLSIDEECKIEPPVIQYTPVIEWSMSDFVEYPSLRETQNAPVVGQLTDDNGDGVIDSNDTPDIVSVMGNLSYVGSENTDGPLTVIRLISGDGTVVHWTKQKWEWQGEWYEPIAAGTPALGDVDLDGEPEIVVALAPFIDPSESGASNLINSMGHSGNVQCVVAVISRNGELEQMNTTDRIRCFAHSSCDCGCRFRWSTRYSRRKKNLSRQ